MNKPMTPGEPKVTHCGAPHPTDFTMRCGLAAAHPGQHHADTGLHADSWSSNHDALFIDTIVVNVETGMGPRALADELKVALSRVQQLQTEHDAATATNSALSTRVRELEAALAAEQRARDLDLKYLEMEERAFGEGWDNDPTGSSHLSDAGKRANEAHKVADQLRAALLPQVPTNVGDKP